MKMMGVAEKDLFMGPEAQTAFQPVSMYTIMKSCRNNAVRHAVLKIINFQKPGTKYIA